MTAATWTGTQVLEIVDVACEGAVGRLIGRSLGENPHVGGRASAWSYGWARGNALVARTVEEELNELLEAA